MFFFFFSLCSLQSIKDNLRSLVTLLTWPPRWVLHVSVCVKVCAHSSQDPEHCSLQLEWQGWLTCFHTECGLGLEGTCWDKHIRDNSMWVRKTKAESLRKCLRPDTSWRSYSRTMDTNCLMCYLHPAVTLNGDCKMKHYVSQQKGKCKLIVLLFRWKCLSRLEGIQGLWHQNNLFYYNTPTRTVLGAVWGTQMARWNSTVAALTIAFSTCHMLSLIGEVVAEPKPFHFHFKDEMIRFSVNTGIRHYLTRA